MIITVFHGSTMLFDTIDIKKGKPYKDFGRGFYVTRNLHHAKNLALRNQRGELIRGLKSVAYLYTFELDIDLLEKNCKIKHFQTADFKWLDFVLENRKSRDKVHNYDVVIGPTANDNTSVVLSVYFEGLYGEIGSQIAKETAIRQLETDNLPPQMYFGTDKSAKYLILKHKVNI